MASLGIDEAVTRHLMLNSPSFIADRPEDTSWINSRVAEEEKFSKKWRREGYFRPFWSLIYTGAKRRFAPLAKQSKMAKNELLWLVLKLLLYH